MAWTYKEITKHTSRPAASLAGYANLLYDAREQVCALSPYVFMTDAARTENAVDAARRLPVGSALIYRHFGAADRREAAQALREVCSARDIQFFIAADIELALTVKADGVHFPEKTIEKAISCREAHPHLVLTGAAHSQAALQACAKAGLDAAFLSPVFPSDSPSAGTALGVKMFVQWAGAAKLPVFALGGVNIETAAQLLGTPCVGIAGVSAFAKRGADNLDKDTAGAMAVLHAQGFDNGWPDTDFITHIDNPHDDVLGMWQGDNLVSFIIVRTSDDQSEVLTVVVDENKRGQGYGADILAAGERAAQNRGADIMFLEVAKDNVAAIALYQNNGYFRCGLRKGYYRRAMGRVDALLFQKKLTSPI